MGALVVASGCGEEPVAAATVMDPPQIVWQDGHRPDSPLEADPWVQALRARSLGTAMAWNTGDFTIRQLTDYVTEERTVELAERYARQGRDASVYLGPGVPFEPLEVVVLDDGSAAAVVVCVPYLATMRSTLPTWSTVFPPFESRLPEVRDPEAYAEVWYQRADEETGERYLIDSEDPLVGELEWQVRDSEREPCDPEAVPVGWFDPEPALPRSTVTGPVREPLVGVE